MTAHTDSNNGMTRARTSDAWVSVCETAWGYIISSDTQWSNRSVLIERVCAAAGIAFLIAASGSWLFPQVQAAMPLVGGVSAKLASSLGMAVPALLFLWVSERGMGHEIHVDVMKGCLRHCVCNRKGKSRIVRTVAFDTIGSAYIKRGANSLDMAQLFVRLVDGQTVLHLVSGREATLRLLHGRLSQELRPVRTQMPGWDRIGHRLMPTAR